LMTDSRKHVPGCSHACQTILLAVKSRHQTGVKGREPTLGGKSNIMDTVLT
jgi:hypothetical protein